MKKIIAMVALVFSCMLAYAQTNGEVIVMNKAMFIKDVFDYEKSQDWKYKGNKPAIIDFVDNDFIGILFGQFLHNGSHHAARSAPVGI